MDFLRVFVAQSKKAKMYANRQRRRLTALALVFLFSIQTAVLPFTGSGALIGGRSSTYVEKPLVETLQIPATSGRIIKRYDAEDLSAAASSLVVYIQDPHGNQSAQGHIKEILDYLYRQYGFKQLYIEGGLGSLDAGLLRFFDRQDLNRKTVNVLAESGAIGGPELFLFDHLDKRGAGQIHAQGAEEAFLYRENLDLYRQVKMHDGEIASFLKELRAKMLKRASDVLGRALWKFFRDWMVFETSDADVVRHLEVLKRQAIESLGLDLGDSREQVSWPQLVRYFALKKMERRLSSARAKIEAAGLKKWLESKKLARWVGEVDRVCDSSIGGQVAAAGEFTLRQRLERFYDNVYPEGFSFKDYPQWSRLAAVRLLESEMDGNLLFSEVRRLDELILKRLIATEKERQFFNVFRRFALLEKLLLLELVSEDFRLFRENPRQVEPGLMAESLGAAFPISNGVKSAYDSALRFYETAKKREGAMMETLLPAVRQRRAAVVVFVAGGFHSDGVTDALRQNHVSYVEVVPHLNSVTEDKSYEDLMSLARDRYTLKTHLRFFSRIQPLEKVTAAQLGPVYASHGAAGLNSAIGRVLALEPKVFTRRVRELNRSPSFRGHGLRYLDRKQGGREFAWLGFGHEPLVLDGQAVGVSPNGPSVMDVGTLEKRAESVLGSAAFIRDAVTVSNRSELRGQGREETLVPISVAKNLGEFDEWKTLVRQTKASFRIENDISFVGLVFQVEPDRNLGDKVPLSALVMLDDAEAMGMTEVQYLETILESFFNVQMGTSASQERRFHMLKVSAQDQTEGRKNGLVIHALAPGSQSAGARSRSELRDHLQEAKEKYLEGEGHAKAGRYDEAARALEQARTILNGVLTDPGADPDMAIAARMNIEMVARKLSEAQELLSVNKAVLFASADANGWVNSENEGHWRDVLGVEPAGVEALRRQAGLISGLIQPDIMLTPEHMKMARRLGTQLVTDHSNGVFLFAPDVSAAAAKSFEQVKAKQTEPKPVSPADVRPLSPETRKKTERPFRFGEMTLRLNVPNDLSAEEGQDLWDALDAYFAIYWYKLREHESARLDTAHPYHRAALEFGERPSVSAREVSVLLDWNRSDTLKVFRVFHRLNEIVALFNPNALSSQIKLDRDSWYRELVAEDYPAIRSEYMGKVSLELLRELSEKDEVSAEASAFIVDFFRHNSVRHEKWDGFFAEMVRTLEVKIGAGRIQKLFGQEPNQFVEQKLVQLELDGISFAVRKAYQQFRDDGSAEITIAGIYQLARQILGSSSLTVKDCLSRIAAWNKRFGDPILEDSALPFISPEKVSDVFEEPESTGVLTGARQSERERERTLNRMEREVLETYLSYVEQKKMPLLLRTLAAENIKLNQKKLKPQGMSLEALIQRLNRRLRSHGFSALVFLTVPTEQAASNVFRAFMSFSGQGNVSEFSFDNLYKALRDLGQVGRSVDAERSLAEIIINGDQDLAWSLFARVNGVLPEWAEAHTILEVSAAERLEEIESKEAQKAPREYTPEEIQDAVENVLIQYLLDRSWADSETGETPQKYAATFRELLPADLYEKVMALADLRETSLYYIWAYWQVAGNTVRPVMPSAAAIRKILSGQDAVFSKGDVEEDILRTFDVINELIDEPLFRTQETEYLTGKPSSDDKTILRVYLRRAAFDEMLERATQKVFEELAAHKSVSPSSRPRLYQAIEREVRLRTRWNLQWGEAEWQLIRAHHVLSRANAHSLDETEVQARLRASIKDFDPGMLMPAVERVNRAFRELPDGIRIALHKKGHAPVLGKTLVAVRARDYYGELGFGDREPKTQSEIFAQMGKLKSRSHGGDEYQKVDRIWRVLKRKIQVTLVYRDRDGVESTETAFVGKHQYDEWYESGLIQFQRSELRGQEEAEKEKNMQLYGFFTNWGKLSATLKRWAQTERIALVGMGPERLFPREGDEAGYEALRESLVDLKEYDAMNLPSKSAYLAQVLALFKSTYVALGTPRIKMEYAVWKVMVPDQEGNKTIPALFISFAESETRRPGSSRQTEDEARSELRQNLEEANRTALEGIAFASQGRLEEARTALVRAETLFAAVIESLTGRSEEIVQLMVEAAEWNLIRVRNKLASIKRQIDEAEARKQTERERAAIVLAVALGRAGLGQQEKLIHAVGLLKIEPQHQPQVVSDAEKLADFSAPDVFITPDHVAVLKRSRPRGFDVVPSASGVELKLSPEIQEAVRNFNELLKQPQATQKISPASLDEAVPVGPSVTQQKTSPEGPASEQVLRSEDEIFSPLAADLFAWHEAQKQKPRRAAANYYREAIDGYRQTFREAGRVTIQTMTDETRKPYYEVRILLANLRAALQAAGYGELELVKDIIAERLLESFPQDSTGRTLDVEDFILAFDMYRRTSRADTDNRAAVSGRPVPGLSGGKLISFNDFEKALQNAGLELESVVRDILPAEGAFRQLVFLVERQVKQRAETSLRTTSSSLIEEIAASESVSNPPVAASVGQSSSIPHVPLSPLPPADSGKSVEKGAGERKPQSEQEFDLDSNWGRQLVALDQRHRSTDTIYAEYVQLENLVEWFQQGVALASGKAIESPETVRAAWKTAREETKRETFEALQTIMEYKGGDYRNQNRRIRQISMTDFLIIWAQLRRLEAKHFESGQQEALNRAAIEMTIEILRGIMEMPLGARERQALQYPFKARSLKIIRQLQQMGFPIEGDVEEWLTKILRPGRSELRTAQKEEWHEKQNSVGLLAGRVGYRTGAQPVLAVAARSGWIFASGLIGELGVQVTNLIPAVPMAYAEEVPLLERTGEARARDLVETIRTSKQQLSPVVRISDVNNEVMTGQIFEAIATLTSLNDNKTMRFVLAVDREEDARVLSHLWTSFLSNRFAESIDRNQVYAKVEIAEISERNLSRRIPAGARSVWVDWISESPEPSKAPGDLSDNQVQANRLLKGGLLKFNEKNNGYGSSLLQAVALLLRGPEDSGLRKDSNGIFVQVSHRSFLEFGHLFAVYQALAASA